MKPSRLVITLRDQQVFIFLWLWKLATTATIAHKFFSRRKPITVYLRLSRLAKSGFIVRQKCNNFNSDVWTLAPKGYECIKHKLDPCREYGYKSEHPDHDLLVNAVHLGEWLNGCPDEVDRITEQQLRRTSHDSLPQWIPCGSVHRPDGYWCMGTGPKRYVVALEVELNVKNTADYRAIGKFYAHHLGIHLVLWVVPSPSAARRIHEELLRHADGDMDSHAFVLVDDFQNLGWRARIQRGVHKDKTIAAILNKSLQHAPTTILQQPYNSCCTRALLDNRNRSFDSQPCTAA